MFRVTKLSIRLHSTKILNNSSIYVVSIPITSKKSYIYCNHKPNLLPKSQSDSIPLVNRVEEKATNIATKGWSTLVNSDKSWNVKIVSWIRKLLNTIPYEENCLKSFPSKAAMIREINEEEDVDSTNVDKTNNVKLQSAIDGENFKQLKPIPFYYPNFQNPSNILTQLYHFRDNAYSKHYKYAWLCGIGIPISLPMALLPVVPNIPGFYLAYRLYCHIKALQGVNHLSYLLESDTPDDILDTTHLKFINLDLIDGIYNNIQLNDHEQVIITEDIIDKLTQRLSLPHLKMDLLKAMKQETKHLHQNQQKINEIESNAKDSDSK